MNKFPFMKIIETPVINDVKLQKENKVLQETKTTVAYIFKGKKYANIFAKDVKQYVKNVEIIDGKKKNTFKVRLKLNQDNSGKNKDTMKVVDLAQNNYGKIDIRENKILELMTQTIFTPPKPRNLKDWENDSIDALEKAIPTKSNDEYENEPSSDEDWEAEEGAEDYEDWGKGVPENNQLPAKQIPMVKPKEKQETEPDKDDDEK